MSEGARGTVALPTLNGVRMTPDIRIAVGLRKNDKSAPEKLDHFILTRYNPQAKSYTIDEPAMKALCEELQVARGDCKPKRIPISVLANLITVPDAVTGEQRLEVPESILRTRMAFYWGSRCQCASEKFTLKNQEQCEADGIDFPPDPEALISWIGRARTRKYSDKGKLINESKHACNPMTCKFATGEGNTKYPGVPLCKPQTLFSCMFPWLPRIGTVAKFVTTSWQSTALLRSSLLEIGALNQGWLVMLPLWLVVEIRRVSSEGYTSPIVHVEYEGTVKQLRAAAQEGVEQLVGLERQMVALHDPMLALESGDEAQAYAREFAHDTVGEDPARPPAVDAYFEQEAEADLIEAMSEEEPSPMDEERAEAAGYGYPPGELEFDDDDPFPDSPEFKASRLEVDDDE